MNEFWLCFVPLFVAVDPVGIVPLFLGLTHGLPRERVRVIILESMLTAGLVSLLFLFGGTYVMRLLGITTADFMVAGGVILFAIAVMDVLTLSKDPIKAPDKGMGAVPLGVPLIAGPAVLATIVLLQSQHGLLPLGLAVAANILIAGVSFWLARTIFSVLGGSGTAVISKIANLLLAAIAVMIIRKGLSEFLSSPP